MHFIDLESILFPPTFLNATFFCVTLFSFITILSLIATLPSLLLIFPSPAPLLSTSPSISPSLPQPPTFFVFQIILMTDREFDMRQVSFYVHLVLSSATTLVKDN